MSNFIFQDKKKTGSRISTTKGISFLFAILLAVSLNNSYGQNTWTRKADFAGTDRYFAVGFSIGSIGYFGCGTDNISGNRKDFWEYDPITDTWAQKADFKGPARYQAVGFSIGSKGYYGMGSDYPTYYKDFWEYDPTANTWTQKTDFGGTARFGTVGFSIGDKGYIGLGFTNDGTTYKDFWEYSPATDHWSQKTSFKGDKRNAAVGFSIGNKGYIGLGTSHTDGSDYKDFWEYDPDANTWTQKADFGGVARYSAVGFSIGNKGYIGTGIGSNLYKDFWEYDPAADIWNRKADFTGNGRWGAVGFSIGDKGYIGTGNDTNGLTKDFWEYTPDEATECQTPVALEVPAISDTAAVLKWTLPSDSVNGFDILYHIIVSTPVHKRHTGGSINHIAIGNLVPGTIYRWKIRSDCTTDTTKWINGPDFTSTSLLGPVAKANVYPNPARNIVTVNYTAYDAGKYFFEITDISGNVLLHKEANAIPGTNSVALDVSSLFKGAYFINIINPDKTRERMQLSIE
jgi:hypothetical protein